MLRGGETSCWFAGYRDHYKGADLRTRSKSQKSRSCYWGEFLPAKEGLEQTERGLIIKGASLGTALASERSGEKIQEVWGPGSRQGGTS